MNVQSLAIVDNASGVASSSAMTSSASSNSHPRQAVAWPPGFGRPCPVESGFAHMCPMRRAAGWAWGPAHPGSPGPARPDQVTTARTGRCATTARQPQYRNSLHRPAWL